MKMRQFVLGAAAVVAAFTAVAPALADTLYSNPVGLYTGIYSDPNLFIAYDGFTATSGATVTSLDWFGANPNTPESPSSFTIGLYSNNGDAPGTLLASSVVGDGSPSFYGVDNGSYDVYQYTSAVTPFEIDAGTTYWLSIVGNSENWAWETSIQDYGTSLSYSETDPGLVESNGDDLAFTLYGTPSPTPEPSSLILMGTALAGACILRRSFLRRVPSLQA